MDLTLIKGTGPNGRIVLEDVESYIQNAASPKVQNAALPANPAETRIPMSQMRKVISTRMSESWKTSPAVTFDMKVDVTRLKEMRKSLKEIHNITFTDLLIK